MLRTEFETYGHTEIEVDVHFSAGHRILGHTGKCKWLHGHSYTAKVKVAVRKLNELDMVIDFTVLKEWLKNWINENWDHNMILHAGDCLIPVARETAYDVFKGRKPYTMQCGNPTAENMAQELYLQLHNVWLNIPEVYDSLKGRYAWIKEVAIKEEEGSWARYCR